MNLRFLLSIIMFGTVLTAAQNNFTLKEINSQKDNFFKDLRVTALESYLYEDDILFKTSTFIQRYRIEKTIANKFSFSITPVLEYASRDSLDIIKTRWYDNYTGQATYLFNDINTISVFGGGSISDKRASGYGFTLQNGFKNDKFSVRNHLTGAYDYFYYWNEVDQYYISDNLNISYDRFTLNTLFRKNLIKESWIDFFETIGDNYGTLLNLDLQTKLVINPLVFLTLSYRYQDYDYDSPLFYSPSDRNLYGASAGFYFPFGKLFLYGQGTYKIDNEQNIIWSYDGEFGYDYENFNISLGLSRYFDPYYKNYYGFLNIGKTF